MQENNAGHSDNQNNESTQPAERSGGNEALEGNTGVGGGSVDQGGDSDGNSGIMSNDDLEEQEPGNSLPGTQDIGGSEGD